MLVPALRDLIRTLHPLLPVPQVRTLADQVAGSIADRRLRIVPAAGFAALALAVTMVGRPLRDAGAGRCRTAAGAGHPRRGRRIARKARPAGSGEQPRRDRCRPCCGSGANCSDRPESCRSALRRRSSRPGHACDGNRRCRSGRAHRFGDSSSSSRSARPDEGTPDRVAGATPCRSPGAQPTMSRTPFPAAR